MADVLVVAGGGSDSQELQTVTTHHHLQDQPLPHGRSLHCLLPRLVSGTISTGLLSSLLFSFFLAQIEISLPEISCTSHS